MRVKLWRNYCIEKFKVSFICFAYLIIIKIEKVARKIKHALLAKKWNEKWEDDLNKD